MRDEDWPLLPGERRIRFGCGALAGVVLRIYLAMRMSRVTVEAVILIAGFSLLLGVPSALFGERFWNLFRWW
jgi:hypothetical protein